MNEDPNLRESLQEYVSSVYPGSLVGDFIVIMAADVIVEDSTAQHVVMVTSNSHPYRLDGLMGECNRRMNYVIHEYDNQKEGE